ncbi:putative dehydrogenase [Friedmanniella endophytica]|uniref:Putative dehydrogenase n=1 Tax=Microlunatus kandeliicorticis TaxID=1759536 RepID=A0A7W3IR58_9ACTN|nr:Gfo/Idh/MocA family oxidoreductase [Microlunatus kandeliicorticis]MBA8793716.1 putative dehydrogenase [Microlunatus kandeliicorticis]
MSALRIGVIGGGAIANLHLTSYAKNPDVEIAAIADVNADRAATVAAQWGASRSYGSPAELLADADIDAVSICTWNNTHAELAVAAVEAGKHVLVEKPLARTYAEARTVQEAAEKSDRVVSVGFVRRFSTNCRVLKSFIDEGRLGDIYYAKASAIRRVGNPGGWFADKSISGGGPLIDVGVHVIDLCWYLMGSPRAVAVSGNTYERLGNRSNITSLPRWKVADYDPAKNDVEDMANAVVRFENGASLMVDVSYSLHTPSEGLNVSVYGDRGGAQLEPELQIATEVLDTVVNMTPQIRSGTFDGVDGFDTEINWFVAACRGERENIAPAWHGVEVQKILDGIYASADAGREIALD